MAAELPEAGRVALCVAVGCAAILGRLLGFLQGAPARGPVLDAAVVLVALFVTLTLPMAFLAGVILLNTQIAAAAAATPAVLAAFRQYVLLVCAPLVLLFTAFHFLAAGGW